MMSSTDKTEEITGDFQSKTPGSKNLKMVLRYDVCKLWEIFRESAAEFLGSALLVIFGCGSALTVEPDLKPTVITIAVAFGLTVATIIWSIGHISGAHINPCVTLAMCLTRKLSLLKTMVYVVAQMTGATAGAVILYALTPANRRGTLGVTLVNEQIDVWTAVGVEFIATFVLVFAIFATCDKRRSDHLGSPALSIGLVVTMDIPWAIQYTGASMNTARSFGPAVVMGLWEHHWVFWLGPLLGGIVAGLLYDHVFAANSSLAKTKACLLSSNYDDEKYRAHKMKIRIIEEESDEDLTAEDALDEKNNKDSIQKDVSPV